MVLTKISISGDEQTLAEIKAAAAEDAESVSTWLLDAARAELRNRALGQAVNEALLQHGISRDEAIAAYESARRSSLLPSMAAA